MVIENQLNVNFSTNSAPVGSIALQLAKINGRLLDLELTALEREKHIEIIASPRLLTTNKKKCQYQTRDGNSLCDETGKR